MASAFEFDGTDFEAACTHLREAAEMIDAEVTKAVVEIGEEFKETAKIVAGQHSTSIPPTIRSVAIPHAVSVRAGNAEVPLAALYDLGNKGKGGRKRGEFYHPTFGHKPSVAQVRHPFFKPTRKLMRKQIKARMEATWEEALRPFERGSER